MSNSYRDRHNPDTGRHSFEISLYGDQMNKVEGFMTAVGATRRSPFMRALIKCALKSVTMPELQKAYIEERAKAGEGRGKTPLKFWKFNE